MFYVASPEIPGSIATAMKPLYVISQGKFFLDEILKGLDRVCRWSALRSWRQCLIKDLIDGIVDSVGAIPKALSSIPRQFHAGVVSSYAGVMWVGVVAAVVLVLYMF